MRQIWCNLDGKCFRPDQWFSALSFWRTPTAEVPLHHHHLSCSKSVNFNWFKTGVILYIRHVKVDMIFFFLPFSYSFSQQDQSDVVFFTAFIEGLKTENVVRCTDCQAPWGKLWFLILGCITKILCDMTYPLVEPLFSLANYHCQAVSGNCENKYGKDPNLTNFILILPLNTNVRLYFSQHDFVYSLNKPDLTYYTILPSSLGRSNPWGKRTLAGNHSWNSTSS